MRAYSSDSQRNVEGEEFREDVCIPAPGRPQAVARSTARLTAEDLAPLTQISSWRSALAVLQTWSIISLMVGIALVFWSWPVALLAVFVIAAQQHALFILSHDAAHYRLFRHRGINDLVGRACAAAAGLSMSTYRIIHRLHHNHLYGPHDPDIALHGGYPRGKGYLARKLLKDLSGATALKTYAYFFGNPAKNIATQTTLDPLADTSPRLRKQARSDQICVIALQLALPALVLWFAGWRGLLLYIVLWVLPALTALQAILRLRAVCEHGAVADLSSALTAARTQLPSGNRFVAGGACGLVSASRQLSHRASPVPGGASLSSTAAARCAGSARIAARRGGDQRRHDDAQDLRRSRAARHDGADLIRREAQPAIHRLA